MKRGSAVTLLLMMGSLASSCATSALWRATHPMEFLAISKEKADEQELKASGLTYYVDTKRDLIYVEKSKRQKTKDYTIRTLGTPVTVIIDATIPILVVGLVVGDIYCLTHNMGGVLPRWRTKSGQAAGKLTSEEEDSLKERLRAIPNEEILHPNQPFEATR